MIELLTTDYGLIAMAATAAGLLLPLGFHLFIRHQVRESERAQLRAQAQSSSRSPGFAAEAPIDPPAED